MKRLVFLLCLLSGLVIILESSALAYEITSSQKRLQQIRRKITSIRQVLKQKYWEEKKLRQSLQKINQKLNRLQRQSSQCSRQIAEIQKKIRQIQSEQQRVQKQIMSIKNQLSHRLQSIYAWQRIGTINLIPIGSLQQYLITSVYLIQIATRDQRLLSKYLNAQKELESLKNQHQAQFNKLTNQLAVLDSIKKEMAQQKAKKQRFLKQVRQTRLKYQSQLQRLKKDAARLEALIRHLRRQSIKTKVIIHPGQMPWPAPGKVIVSFGRYWDKFSGRYFISNGIEIKVKPGTLFRAVAAGKVVYADWLHSYGNLIIINHGNGYYTLYAHAISLYKKVGQWVRQGEVLGKIANDTLYFELRHHTTPIDPFVWLKPYAGGK